MIKEKHEKETEEEKAIACQFLLNENVWAKAKVANDTGKVGIWLGANVMVEYTIEDALKLLNKNLSNA